MPNMQKEAEKLNNDSYDPFNPSGGVNLSIQPDKPKHLNNNK